MDWSGWPEYHARTCCSLPHPCTLPSAHN